MCDRNENCDHLYFERRKHTNLVTAEARLYIDQKGEGKDRVGLETVYVGMKHNILIGEFMLEESEKHGYSKAV